MSALANPGPGTGTGTVAPAPAVAGWRRVLRRTLRQPLTVAALGFVLLLLVVALAAPLLAPYSPYAVNVAQRLQGPSGAHWFGTDELGRDQFSRVVYGSRVALVASFESVSIAAALGVPLGLAVGYLGGWWDRITQRLIEVLTAIPTLLLAFAISAVFGRGLAKAMIAIVLAFVIYFVRLARGVVLAERGHLYVDAGRVLGLRSPRLLFGEILPNVAGPLLVQAFVFLGTAQLFEAMLGFLGLGLDITQSDWGQMLDQARQYQAQQPLLAVFPGLAIMSTVLAFNVIGSGLGEAFGRDTAGAPPWTRRRKAPKPTMPALTQDTTSPEPLLRVTGLSVRFPGPGPEPVAVVDDVSLDLVRGEVFGLVGESGSGKSITALAITGLVPPPGLLAAGSVRFDGAELAGLGDKDLARIRGARIAMVFQDPIASLSPVHTIGRQIAEPARLHHGLSARAARARAVELLHLVGVPDPAGRIDDYPHQFSGGMAQRVAIARALAGEPDLLIADEPTTALDVTIQRQVLDLLLDLRDRLSMSLLLITHDLGVVADTCDRVAVMYAGQIVETAEVTELFDRPRHPYTRALIAANPHSAHRVDRLPTVPGTVPAPWNWPGGCRFAPRCAHAAAECGEQAIPFVDGARCVRLDQIVIGGHRVSS